VEPVFARLRRHLEGYTPEKAGNICEIHPDNIRTLARKVATRKTKIFIGWNSGKYYHGDLMERAMALLLGLTGNWGKKGTGTRSWAITGYDGEAFLGEKDRPGQEAALELIGRMIAMRRLVAQSDPTMTEEMTVNRVATMAAEISGQGFPMPPVFAWYYQFGYKERWDNEENHDPSMQRSFEEYVQEATDKGWWDPRYAQIYRDVEPRVIFEAGGNMLRRQRGGQKLLLEHLWPKLKMVVSCDYRITTTGLYSDYILPAAQHYEKMGFSMPSVHHLNYVLCDKATEPEGNALHEYEIGIRQLEAIERRAAARGMSEFTDLTGKKRSLKGLVDLITHKGALRDQEKRIDEAVRDNAVYGVLPKGTTLETLREKGAVRYTGWGMVGHGLSQASTIEPDQTHNPLRWHTEDKKEPPPQGGAKRRFQMTSGHNRWSIHSMNMTNNIIQNTHRGEPFVFVNDKDAASLGIENGEQVRLVSDVGDCLIAAKITPACRPNQVIVYNGFEPYMHENWYSQADLEPGHVKHLGFAAGYGHLTYRPLSWQPIPADRGVRVDVEKVS
jgi:anaerobic selenocysteine-containing dehydrogenase